MMVFSFILRPCSLDESRLNIGRVNKYCHYETLHFLTFPSIISYIFLPSPLDEALHFLSFPPKKSYSSSLAFCCVDIENSGRALGFSAQ